MSHKLASRLDVVVPSATLAINAKAVAEMATIDGARAIHLEKEIGSLEKGKKADLILISLDEPNAVPMYDVYAAIAYALKGSDVKTVIIGGAPADEKLKLSVGSLKCKVFATYGMTETISHIALQKLNGADRQDYFQVLPGISIQTDQQGCLTIH